KQGTDLERVRHEVYEMQRDFAAKGLAGPPHDLGSAQATMSADRAGASLAEVTSARGYVPVHHALGLALRACEGLSDFLAIADLSTIQIRALLDLARLLKTSRPDDVYQQGWILRGKSAALIFEKPSLRTRVTFEV